MMYPDKNSKILVVGLGKRSGLYACNFLINKGYKVYASDIKTADELQDILKDLDPRVEVLARNQSPEILSKGIDLIILSPGVPGNIPLIETATSNGIPVIAEVELA